MYERLSAVRQAGSECRIVPSGRRTVQQQTPLRLDSFGMVGATGIALRARKMRDSDDTLAILSER